MCPRLIIDTEKEFVVVYPWITLNKLTRNLATLVISPIVDSARLSNRYPICGSPVPRSLMRSPFSADGGRRVFTDGN
ncbi:hypothetical protein L596_003813 [Steinernema carpocapsae]|uniref:Uncharacterized protein n=1 Tax=Steinernema carpocapsae TaxID=34508 RepID=A0A4U8UTT9_STECR|nr:hypothetical protein L596_003813 [Steinernema carpocapsae]